MRRMSERDMTRLMIERRIAEKRRHPHLTKAKNAFNKAKADLLKKVGEPANVEAFNAAGEIVFLGGALEVLQRGEPVTLKAYVCTKVGTHAFLDPDVMEVKAESTVKIDITK